MADGKGICVRHIDDSALGETFDGHNLTSAVDPDQSVAIDVPEVPANMAESRTYEIHKFNGQNYQLWKMQMEIYMGENELEPYILGTVQRPATNPEDWDKKEKAAKAFLMRGLEIEQLKYLTQCKTAAQMWSRLKVVHAEKSYQSAQVLLDRFIKC